MSTDATLVILAISSRSVVDASGVMPCTATAALPFSGHTAVAAGAGSMVTCAASTTGATSVSGHSRVDATYAPQRAATSPTGASTRGRSQPGVSPAPSKRSGDGATAGAASDPTVRGSSHVSAVVGCVSSAQTRGGSGLVSASGPGSGSASGSASGSGAVG